MHCVRSVERTHAIMHVGFDRGDIKRGAAEADMAIGAQQIERRFCDMMPGSGVIIRDDMRDDQIGNRHICKPCRLLPEQDEIELGIVKQAEEISGGT